MKTAHRKELETNYLADQINRIVEGRNPHLRVWLALLFVGALVALGYWAVPRQARQRVSLAWRELWRTVNDRSDAPEQSARALDELAKEQRGTPIVPAARYAQACAELETAQRSFHDRQAAEAHLYRAEQLFRSLLAENNLSGELLLRTRLGLAELAETRYWLEKSKLDQSQHKKRLQEVTALYREALRTPGADLRMPHGELHPLLQHCQKRIQQLEDPKLAELVFLRPPSFAPSSEGPPAPPPSGPQ